MAIFVTFLPPLSPLLIISRTVMFSRLLLSPTMACYLHPHCPLHPPTQRRGILMLHPSSPTGITPTMACIPESQFPAIFTHIAFNLHASTVITPTSACYPHPLSSRPPSPTTVTPATPTNHHVTLTCGMTRLDSRFHVGHGITLFTPP